MTTRQQSPGGVHGFDARFRPRLWKQFSECYCHLVCFNCDNYLPRFSSETWCLSLVFNNLKVMTLFLHAPDRMLHSVLLSRLCPHALVVMWQQALNALQCFLGNWWSCCSWLGEHGKKFWTWSVEAVSQELALRWNSAAKPRGLGSVWDPRKSNNYWGTTDYTQKNRVSPPRNRSCFVAAYSSCLTDVFLPLLIMKKRLYAISFISTF